MCTDWAFYPLGRFIWELCINTCFEAGVVLALQAAKVTEKERQSLHFSADVKIMLVFAHTNPEYQIHNFVSSISMICFFLHGPK